jgi:large subunit ribosomal protein L30
VWPNIDPKSKIQNPKSKEMAKKKEETKSESIKIQYYRSSIGYSQKQKDIVKSLGITKLNQVVEKPDNAAMRGVVAKVPHLLRIVE